MSARATSRQLRQSGLFASGDGGVKFLCRALFSSKRAASTASELPSAKDPATNRAPKAIKKNVYNPPSLPISPIMDPVKYIPMSRRYTAKLQRPKGNETLTPREEALKTNPYARILETDIRNEVDFHRRLPSWFLIRFVLLEHPETHETYLAPDRLREGSESQQRLAQGKWAINNKELFEMLNIKRRWRKLAGVHDIDSKKIVWKFNMSSHILELLRKRVCVELGKLPWIDIVEMPWDDGNVGCVLDWSENWDEEKECLTMVKGKEVPLHHMRTLLGDEMATELQTKKKIPDEVVRTGILLHERSLKAQMWLMRIRAYFGICMFR